MAQCPLYQDWMTNDFYLQILYVKPENTVDTKYVHIRRNCSILYTAREKTRKKCLVLVIETWTKESWALEFTPKIPV